MLMRDVIEAVNREITGPVNVVTGVGTHQQLVARHFTFNYPQRRFISSCGNGTMGFGLPAAIGAAITDRLSQTILFNGDGSMGMDMVHLPTAVEYGCWNLRVVVLDNNSYGIVQQFEELNGLRPVATAHRANPAFADVAAACGWDAFEFIDGDIGTAVRKLFGARGPALMHVHVSDNGVWPILESKHALDDMSWPGGTTQDYSAGTAEESTQQ